MRKFIWNNEELEKVEQYSTASTAYYGETDMHITYTPQTGMFKIFAANPAFSTPILWKKIQGEPFMNLDAGKVTLPKAFETVENGPIILV